MEKNILSVFVISLALITFTSCTEDDPASATSDCMNCGAQITFHDDTTLSDDEQDFLIATYEASNAEYCEDDLEAAQSLYEGALYTDITNEDEGYTVDYGCW